MARKDLGVQLHCGVHVGFWCSLSDCTQLSLGDLIMIRYTLISLAPRFCMVRVCNETFPSSLVVLPPPAAGLKISALTLSLVAPIDFTQYPGWRDDESAC